MAKTKTHRWDPADHLRDAADMVAYLEAALAEKDPALIAGALDDIARAKGMPRPRRRRGAGKVSPRR